MCTPALHKLAYILLHELHTEGRRRRRRGHWPYFLSLTYQPSDRREKCIAGSLHSFRLPYTNHKKTHKYYKLFTKGFAKITMIYQFSV